MNTKAPAGFGRSFLMFVISVRGDFPPRLRFLLIFFHRGNFIFHAIFDFLYIGNGTFIYN